MKVNVGLNMRSTREKKKISFILLKKLLEDLFKKINSFKKIVGSGFECFHCYVNKPKPNGPSTINLVENGLKSWALVRVATTEHDRK